MSKKEKPKSLARVHLEADLKALRLVKEEFSHCCTVMNPNKHSVLAVVDARIQELEKLLDERSK